MAGGRVPDGQVVDLPRQRPAFDHLVKRSARGAADGRSSGPPPGSLSHPPAGGQRVGGGVKRRARVPGEARLPPANRLTARSLDHPTVRPLDRWIA